MLILINELKHLYYFDCWITLSLLIIMNFGLWGFFSICTLFCISLLYFVINWGKKLLKLDTLWNKIKLILNFIKWWNRLFFLEMCWEIVRWDICKTLENVCLNLFSKMEITWNSLFIPFYTHIIDSLHSNLFM